MENMIKQGAKLLIPASFGYLDPRLNPFGMGLVVAGVGDGPDVKDPDLQLVLGGSFLSRPQKADQGKRQEDQKNLLPEGRLFGLHLVLSFLWFMGLRL